MSDIGPGDFVECSPPAGYRGEVTTQQIRCVGPYPKPGGIYRVREAGTYNGGTPGLRFVGTVVSYDRHPDCWFPAHCFKPIYRPKAEVIEGLLQPIGEDA